MDDDRVTCQICMEKYDMKNDNRLPKKISCCGNIFCFGCLNDIYKRKNNQILCPICRKITTVPPQNLETDNGVFEDFLTCPSCKGKTIKSELFFSFDTHQIKCEKCQQGDIRLNDFIEPVVVDLSSFLGPLLKENMDLIPLIEQKIDQKLTEIFDSIKQYLKREIKNKTIEEINSKFACNLINDYNAFISKVTQLDESYKAMNSFLNNGNEKVDIQKINEKVLYYSQNGEIGKKEIDKFINLYNLVKPNEIFKIRDGIKLEEIQKFMLNVFETVLSDHKEGAFLTGISLFDQQLEEARQQQAKNLESVRKLQESLRQQIMQYEQSQAQNKNPQENNVNEIDYEIDYQQAKENLIKKINLFGSDDEDEKM